MKREIGILLVCVVASIALYGAALFVALQFSTWGQFNSEPPETRPDIQVALASKHRLAVLFHVFVLPAAAILVGFLAGRYARRPFLIALLGILPLRCYFLFPEGMHAVPVFSAVLGVAIALITAKIAAKGLMPLRSAVT